MTFANLEGRNVRESEILRRNADFRAGTVRYF